jgi:hypothetical protein
MRALTADADGRVRLFLDMFIDLFSFDNFSSALEFFIASFNRERDSLGQWRAYADNGRGYALRFVPELFGIIEKPDRSPSENVFVGPVLYQASDVSARHHLAVEKAASIFWRAANANLELTRDKAIGIPFMRVIANTVIASPLIWNCLTSKHPAYAAEQ